MTFPLGSLRGDGADSTLSRALAGHPAPHWREQAALLVGAVVWLIALLALLTHSAADPGFSTSGSGGPIHNRAGVLGAWLSDLGFFIAGYSVWWTIVVGARAWLGALARTLRGHSGATPQPPSHVLPAWTMWLGLAMLLAASASLEWTRLYQWEGQVAGGNAGGVAGLVLGRASQNLLGFAGSGVLWIAMLVAGASLALRVP
jgi:S-DNA-T family DNA segregation ATPase FtsK/SpoIIIE